MTSAGHHGHDGPVRLLAVIEFAAALPLNGADQWQ